MEWASNATGAVARVLPMPPAARDPAIAARRTVLRVHRYRRRGEGWSQRGTEALSSNNAAPVSMSCNSHRARRHSASSPVGDVGGTCRAVASQRNVPAGRLQNSTPPSRGRSAAAAASPTVADSTV